MKYTKYVARTGSGVGGLSAASLSLILSNSEDADSGEFSCVAGTDIPGIGSLVDAVNFNITVLGKKNYMASLFLLSHMLAQVIGQSTCNTLCMY